MFDSTFGSLLTVGGLSVAIIAVVQALKMLDILPDKWPRKMAILLGMVGLPALVVVDGDSSAQALVVAVIVGAQVGVSASGQFDTATKGIDFKTVKDS